MLHEHVDDNITLGEQKCSNAYAYRYNDEYVYRREHVYVNIYMHIGVIYMYVYVCRCEGVWGYGMSTFVGYLTPNPFLWK